MPGVNPTRWRQSITIKWIELASKSSEQIAGYSNIKGARLAFCNLIQGQVRIRRLSKPVARIRD